MAALTAAQIQAFLDCGIVVIPGILSDAEIEEARMGLKDTLFHFGVVSVFLLYFVSITFYYLLLRSTWSDVRKIYIMISCVPPAGYRGSGANRTQAA